MTSPVAAAMATLRPRRDVGARFDQDAQRQTAGVLLDDRHGVVARAAVHDHHLIRAAGLGEQAVQQAADGLPFVEYGADDGDADAASFDGCNR